jgi:hypothetical protein
LLRSIGQYLSNKISNPQITSKASLDVEIVIMSRERPLSGGCSCGRNRYTILIPQDATEVAQVFFDNGHAHRTSVFEFEWAIQLMD